MLKPYDMSKFFISGPKNIQETIIKELHQLNVMHIAEHSKNELADIGQPLEISTKLSELIVRIRGLIAAISINRQDEHFEFKGSTLEIDRTSKKLAEEINKSNEELKKIEELRARNASMLNELSLLKGINVPIGALKPYMSLEVITGFTSINPEELHNSLESITKNFMLFSNESSKGSFIVLFIDKEKKDDAYSSLQKAKFLQVSLASVNSNGLDKKKTAAECIRGMEMQAHRLQSLKENLLKRTKKLASEHRTFLLAAEEFLAEELEKADAPLKFAATKNAFLIEGWVPKDELVHVVERIERVGKNKIFVYYENPGEKDRVPVKLKNSGYVRPFQFFIEMYSLPNYRELDPTFFMFISFPIFFGFMLGDFGYGIVSAALFYWLKKKMPKGEALFNILLLSSISSIFFGLIFGEFFGFEEIGHFEIPHLISRGHSMFELMYIAVAIGIAHVNFGLMAGFANVYKQHGLKHAIYEKASWFVLEAGAVLLVLSILEKIHLHWSVGASFLAASLIMLYKGEGIKGIIEVPSIATNVLSYMRLMAIGLSSVYIAAVVNEMAIGFFHKGGILVIAGVLIFVAGHVLNGLLGLFGSFLHSLRLHYVEFFSKFFHGSGLKYRPFGGKEN